MAQSDLISSTDATAARRVGWGDLPCRVGQWELDYLAAEGGLARVYRARPAGTPADRPASYALKMLRRQWQDDPRAVRLLQREALVGRGVSHPHLVSILQASLNRPPRFVVMPWLDGATLQWAVDSGQWAVGREQSAVHQSSIINHQSSIPRCLRMAPMDLPVALWIARQVAEALEALHAAGWMHGDVKPGNVFLSPEGHATLLDLGFARRSDETGSAVDRLLTGTCNYMAPELITSALRADIRSDIYSLGALLFEVLAGRPPFTGESLAELATQHRRSRPPDLRRLAPGLPQTVADLVHQMLAKDPLRRPQTPRELIDRLMALEIATFSERA